MALFSSPRFGAVVALLLLIPSGAFAQSLAWDPNKEPDVAGYRVLYGTKSGNYTKQLDVGNKTTCQPPVDWSQPHFFAVQAYSTTGLASPLSAEVQWVPPVQSPPAARTVTLKSFTPNATSPFLRDKPVTWTAAVQGSTKAEYRFWMFRNGAWKLVQEYSPANTFTWVPGWADSGGPYHLQVWARAAGSTAQYESYLGTPAYEVVSAPVELTANVDFPTPPDNPVTWSLVVASAPAESLEYKFWLYNEKKNEWTVLRDYGPSNEAVWVPDTLGRFAVQGWARRVGSTDPYDVWTGKYADVTRGGVQLTALSADVSLPVATGTRVTWTARAKGGTTGPLEYQFWLFTEKNGWRVGQPYGTSRVFAWTPQWGDEGRTAVQVWVRNAGSKSPYDAWRGSGVFNTTNSDMHLTTPAHFPLAPGNQVKWSTEAAPSPSVFEYQFWVYKGSTGAWSLGQPYSPNQTFMWTPSSADTYAIQAWARMNGSNASYEKWRGTGFLKVLPSPVRMHSLTSNVELTAGVGTRIIWAATASGGTGPLEYQFWRWSTAGWVIAQKYSRSSTFGWTPTSADVGQYAVQVWVRSAGSGAEYEGFMGTAMFTIKQ